MRKNKNERNGDKVEVAINKTQDHSATLPEKKHKSEGCRSAREEESEKCLRVHAAGFSPCCRAGRSSPAVVVYRAEIARGQAIKVFAARSRLSILLNIHEISS